MRILQEDGSLILLEGGGGSLLLEADGDLTPADIDVTLSGVLPRIAIGLQSQGSTFKLLQEDGSAILQEDGSFILLEGRSGIEEHVLAVNLTGPVPELSVSSVELVMSVSLSGTAGDISADGDVYWPILTQVDLQGPPPGTIDAAFGGFYTEVDAGDSDPWTDVEGD